MRATAAFEFREREALALTGATEDPTRMPITRFRFVATLVAALFATLCAATEAHANDQSLALSLETYFDDATHTSERSFGGIETASEEDEVGRGLLSAAVSLTFMAPVTDALRVGAGVRYLGSYRYRADDAEEDDDDVLLGRMFELIARGEYTISLTKSLALVPAMEFGVPILFASGDLQQELDGLENQGFSVNGLPRVGFLVGAEVGVEYRVEGWFAVRPTVGLLHERLFLINASVDGPVGTADASRALSLMRIRLGVSAVAYF